MSIAKYLHNYAELEAQQNFNFIKPATNCLVIPCRNESIDLLKQLKTLLKNAPSTLIILVINQPESQIDDTINKLEIKNNFLIKSMIKSKHLFSGNTYSLK